MTSQKHPQNLKRKFDKRENELNKKLAYYKKNQLYNSASQLNPKSKTNPQSMFTYKNSHDSSYIVKNTEG